MELKGKQKVAAYLLSLDTQSAADILKTFDEQDIREITEQMVSLKHIDSDTIERLQKEFQSLLTSRRPVGVSNTSAAAEKLLEAALGEEKGHEMLTSRPKAPTRIPFERLNELEPHQAVALLKDEHPQTIAVVMSYLKSPLSAAVLSALPETQHAEIVSRMTKMEVTSHEMLGEMEQLLYEKASEMGNSTADVGSTNRNKAVSEILNMVGKTVRKNVLDHLGQTDPESAEEIENLMFVFEDLAKVDDRAIQKILREVDNQTLALALKNAGDDIREKITGNLSKRAAESMAEEIEMLGPKPLSEVEGAQRDILEAARRLDEAGEITLRQSEQETLV